VKKDLVEMSSSNTSKDRSIILNPTDRLETLNGTSDPRTIYESSTDTLRSTCQAIADETKALFTFHPKEWISAFRPNPKFPLFVVGDIDGFVALFMNNLATLLAVILGLRLVLEDDIIYGKIVPG
jgi:hypothetical protein